MAIKSYVETLVNALPDTERYPMRSAFWYVMDNWRWGTGPRAENGQLYRVQGVTSSIANQEVAIPHHIGAVPTQLIPILDLSIVNAQLVPLTVSRVPDADYLYLKSASTSATFTVMAEV